MGEVIVIGAGPAGRVAALVVARGGGGVGGGGQQRFPRDKVCGECLSALGIETLERLKIAEELRGLGAVALRRTQIWTVGGKRVGLELPREMWGISRRVLDEFLLKRAVEAGAKVVQPGRCEGVE